MKSEEKLVFLDTLLSVFTIAWWSDNPLQNYYLRRDINTKTRNPKIHNADKHKQTT